MQAPILLICLALSFLRLLISVTIVQKNLDDVPDSLTISLYENTFVESELIINKNLVIRSDSKSLLTFTKDAFMNIGANSSLTIINVEILITPPYSSDHPTILAPAESENSSVIIQDCGFRFGSQYDEIKSIFLIKRAALFKLKNVEFGRSQSFTIHSIADIMNTSSVFFEEVIITNGSQPIFSIQPLIKITGSQLVTFSNAFISKNRILFGFEISETKTMTLIKNNTFTQNVLTQKGLISVEAISSLGNSSILITNNIFKNNAISQTKDQISEVYIISSRLEANQNLQLENNFFHELKLGLTSRVISLNGGIINVKFNIFSNIEALNPLFIQSSASFNASNLACESSHGGACLDIYNTAQVNLDYITIQANSAFGQPAGILFIVDSELVSASVNFKLQNSLVTKNQASFDVENLLESAGALFNIATNSKSRTTVDLVNTMFISNKKSSSFMNSAGAALLFKSIDDDSTLNLLSNLFMTNIGDFGVGAVYFVGENFAVKTCDFLENYLIIENSAPQTDMLYGAILAYYSKFLLDQTNFVGNTAYFGTVKLKRLRLKESFICSNTRFYKNYMALEGSGISFDYSSFAREVLLINLSFEENFSSNYGACLFIFLHSNNQVNDSIVCKNCSFIRNFAGQSGSVAVIWVYSRIAYYLFENCLFSEHSLTKDGIQNAPVFEVWNSEGPLIETKYCEYHNNSARYGGAFWVFFGSITDYGSIFINNWAADDGGIIYAIRYSIITFINTIIKNSSSTGLGGAFFVKENSALYLINIGLEDVKSGTGGVVYLNGYTEFLLKNSIIRKANAFSGSILYAKDLRSVEYNIAGNIISEVTGDQALFVLEGGSVKFKDTEFKAIYTALAHLKQTSLGVKNSTVDKLFFEKADAFAGIRPCGFKVENAEEIVLQNLKITNIYDENKSGFLYILRANIVIYENLDLRDIEGGWSNISDCSNISIKGLSLINFTHFGLEFHVATITIQECEISQGKLEFPAITCNDCNNLLVSSSDFYYIKADSSGGALSLKGVDSNSNSIRIENCKFTTIASSLNGGAIYSQDVNLLIKNSFFQACSALYGAGVFLSCTKEAFNYSFLLNEFSNNKADIQGGGVFWDFCEPFNVLNNVFKGNLALSGYHVSSAAKSIFLNEKKENSSLKSSKLSEGKEFYYIEMQSGEQIPFEFAFKLKDIYDNDMIKLSGFKMDAELYTFEALSHLYSLTNTVLEIDKRMQEKTYNFSKKDGLDIYEQAFSDPAIDKRSFNKLYGKKITPQSNDSSFIFDQMRLIGRPNSIMYLRFQSEYFDTPIKLNFIKNKTEGLNLMKLELTKNVSEVNEKLNGVEYIYLLPVVINRCGPGSLFLPQQGRCDKCKKTFFNLKNDSLECLPCPPNAKCLGGDEFHIDKNFWRYDASSAAIFQCDKQIGNCPGGKQARFCKDEYEGILCAKCKSSKDKNIKKNIMGICEECSSMIYSILFLMVAIFAVVALIYVIMRQFLRHDLRDMKGLLKIAINYSQVILLLDFKDIKLPFNQYWNSRNLMNTVGKWLSLDCLFTDEMFFGEDVFNSSFFKMVLMSIVVLIGSAFIYIIVSDKDRRFYVQAEYLTLLLYLFETAILDELLGYLICIEVNGEQYLPSSGIQCWTSTHNKFFYFVVVLLVFFALLAPLLAAWPLLVILFRKIIKYVSQSPKKANNKPSKMLLVSLKGNFYWWEAVLFTRKNLILVFLKVRLHPSYYSSFQVYTCSLILLIYMLLVLSYNPWETNLLNRADAFHSFICLLTFVLYSFYFNPIMDVSQILVFTFIITMNLIYLGFLLRSAYKIIKMKKEIVISLQANSAEGSETQICKDSLPNLPKTTEYQIESSNSFNSDFPKTNKLVNNYFL